MHHRGKEESKKRIRHVMFSSLPDECSFFDSCLLQYKYPHPFIDTVYLSEPLSQDTVHHTLDTDVVSISIRDCANAHLLQQMHANGVGLILSRHPSVERIDIYHAQRLRISVVAPPMHKVIPSIAEFALAQILTLTRGLHLSPSAKSSPPSEVPVSVVLSDLTVGIVGTGEVGFHVAKLLRSFKCRVLAFDAIPNDRVEALGVSYCTLSVVLRCSDVVSLHAPLVPATHYLLRDETLRICKRGVMIVNTSSLELMDISAVRECLVRGHIGALAIDLPPGGEMHVRDIIDMPNVIATSHRAMCTGEALEKMAYICAKSLVQFYNSEPLQYAYRWSNASQNSGLRR